MYRKFDPVEGKNAEIIEAVMNCEEVKNIDEGLQFKVRLCVEEVEENILSYSGTTWVSIQAEEDGNSLVICFKDGGTPFDPLAKDDPDITSNLDDREVGGLGIFLCKQMMDSIEYRHENGSNILTMKLRIA
ncbi:MAG: ATP-binding protein [Bacteroidales bacterium]|nr:ATP-binding protein [Candidatus Cryptobacteroides choladohippi]MCQ2179013.1 ATP-binding protein [Bacteroidales bacterium]